MTALLHPSSPEDTLARASASCLNSCRFWRALRQMPPACFRMRIRKDARSSPDHACAPVVECLLAIAQHHYMAAQAALALAPASQAVEFSRRLSDPAVVAQGADLPWCYAKETGNLPGATESYSEALEIARSLMDPGAEAPVWNNLGLALQNAAQYRDALAMLRACRRVGTSGPNNLPSLRARRYRISPLARCIYMMCAMVLRPCAKLSN